MGSPVRPTSPERPVPPRPAGSAAVALGLLFVALAAAVRAGAGPLLRADLRVVDACHARVLPRPWLHHLLEVLAAVTAPNTWRAVAAVAAAALWLRGRRPAAATLKPTQPEVAGIEKLVRQRQPNFFSYQDWLRLDEIEVTRGKEAGRPRVKFTCVQDMLAALGR